jgi:hypothetical protein
VNAVIPEEEGNKLSNYKVLYKEQVSSPHIWSSFTRVRAVKITNFDDLIYTVLYVIYLNFCNCPWPRTNIVKLLSHTPSWQSTFSLPSPNCFEHPPDISDRGTLNLTFTGLCIVIQSYSTSNKMHLLSQIIILVKRSISFGRSFRPSSGAQNCVYHNSICQTAAATCCYQGWDGTAVPSHPR